MSVEAVEPELNSVPENEGIMESVYEWTGLLVFSLVAFLLLATFVFRSVSVDGSSMLSTLINGERLLVTSYPYTPQRGDIVIVSRENRAPLVKRIIAVGGDVLIIDADEHKVYLNGDELIEPYVYDSLQADGSYSDESDFWAKSSHWEVPQGHVFVMGDNRRWSSDSRDIGYIENHRIIGKAFFRLFPFERFGEIG